jgi:putative ABC transport system permease protein
LAGFLAGLYPSLYLSAFQPAIIMKAGPIGEGKQPLPWFACHIQSFISTALIIGTIVIYNQLKFF